VLPTNVILTLLSLLVVDGLELFVM